MHRSGNVTTLVRQWNIWTTSETYNCVVVNFSREFGMSKRGMKRNETWFDATSQQPNMAEYQSFLSNTSCSGDLKSFQAFWQQDHVVELLLSRTRLYVLVSLLHN